MKLFRKPGDPGSNRAQDDDFEFDADTLGRYDGGYDQDEDFATFELGPAEPAGSHQTQGGPAEDAAPRGVRRRFLGRGGSGDFQQPDFGADQGAVMPDEAAGW